VTDQATPPMNGSSRPPTGAFPVANRLLRGYAPAAVLVLVVALIAILVPSKVQKAASAQSSNAPVTVPTLPTGGGGSTTTTTTAPGHAAGAAGGGSSGSAGHTVTTPGKVQACSGQAQQIPGDPYSPPCITFSGARRPV
jgi:hypothetical protein